jgi:maltose alpha-D-glucosyltransferase/alpha-amylase
MTTFAVLQEYVPNSGDAWSYTLGWLDRFLSDVLTLPARGAEEVLEWPHGDFHLGELPALVERHLGSYLEFARVLGRRTGGLHLALGSSVDHPSFAPEAVPAHHARSLYQSVRTQVGHALRLLRERMDGVPENARGDAVKLLDSEEQLLAWLAGIKTKKLTGKRIRIHGDFHLGQVLVTGRDVAIIDFEGEPERPISERGIKRMALRDVAGMLRSFHYAAYAALPGYGTQRGARPEDLPVLEPWARFWQLWTSAVYLESYLQTVESSKLVPASPEAVRYMLDFFVLEKALYELRYELHNRPGWVVIPLRTILQEIESRDMSPEGGAAT